MTHYDVLGVTPEATIAELRQAYVALARTHHPDRPGGDAQVMRAVNLAWTTLRDPGRRATYDGSLSPLQAAAPPEPEPAAWRTDEEDLLADLADDTPLGGRVVLPRWLSLLPVATFVSSVGWFCAGLMFGSAPAIGLAIGVFVLSCAMFLAAPFVALLSSRRR